MAESINLDNASIMGYSVEKRYLGETFHYSSIHRYTVTSKFAQSKNVKGVSSVLAKYKSLIIQEGANFQDFYLNGKYLGAGRLLSISFDRENPIRIGEFTAEFEVYDNYLALGNMSDSEEHGGLVGGDYYVNYDNMKSALQATDQRYIENLSEDISSSVDGDGKLSISHNLNVKFISGEGTDPVNAAKNIAVKLLYHKDNYYPLFHLYNQKSQDE